MRAAIVVPTIRESNIASYHAWEVEFSEHIVIVVEDNPERTFQISGNNVKHFCWRDIDRALGRDSWIIPARTDCVRSFGYLKAYEEGVDMILTLDDDCYPQDAGFLAQHYKKLFSLTVGGLGINRNRTPPARHPVPPPEPGIRMCD